MPARFSDIKRGQKLAAALTNYTNYLTTAATRPSKIGTRGQRDLKKVLYVTPFSQDIETTQKVMARCSTDSWTEIGAVVKAVTTAEVLEALGGTDTLVAVAGYRPARVVAFINAAYTATKTPSEVTGMDYLKYTGTRSSVPFGRKTATDDENDVFMAIKAAIMAANVQKAICRVNLQREVISAR